MCVCACLPVTDEKLFFGGEDDEALRAEHAGRELQIELGICSEAWWMLPPRDLFEAMDEVSNASP